MQAGLLSVIPAAAFLCYGLLLLVMVRGRKSHINKIFTFYVVGMTIWSFGSFVMRTGLSPGPLFWNRILCVGFLIMPVSLYHFSVSYRKDHNQLVWLVLGYIATIIFQISNWFGGITAAAYLESGNFVYKTGFMAPYFAVIGMSLILGAYYNFIKEIKAGRLNFNQTKFVFLGFAVMAAGGLLNLIPAIGMYPIDLAGAAFNGLALAYAIFKYKFLEINVFINRGLVYSALTVFFTGIYFLCIFFAEALLSGFIDINTYVLAFCIALIIAILFQPAKNGVQQIVDSLFFPEKLEYQNILQNFNKVVNSILDTQTLSNEITKTVAYGLNVNKAALFLSSGEGEKYEVQSFNGENLADSSLSLRADSPIVNELNGRNLLFRNEIEDDYSFKALWEKEKKVVANLNAYLILPVRYMNSMVGIVMLSKKIDNEIFSQEEMNLLTALTGSVGLALENARIYSSVKKEAITDGLTGIYNHRYLHEYLEKELYRAWKSNKEVWLLMIDIDFFKLFNDMYGHHAGDQALRYLASLMLETTHGEYILARYGGEEFTVVMPEVSREEAYRIAQEIRATVEGKFYKMHNKVITVSIGIANYPEDGADRESLINAADKALYCAKVKGRNRTIIYSPELEQNSYENFDPYSSQETYLSTMYALAAAIDVKDHYTFGHSKNVANYGTALSKSLQLDEERTRNIYYAGLLHDIGKIGVPESILTKTDRLSDKEFSIMQKHVDLSVSIVKHISSFLPIVPIVHGHHENFDGSGYPRALKGSHIPIEARILSVADAFDAMTTDRPYRKGMSEDDAIKELLRCADKQFDPEIVEEFRKLLAKGQLVNDSSK